MADTVRQGPFLSMRFGDYLCNNRGRIKRFIL